MKILMVCTGNICRSPTAEGVLRAALERAGLEGRCEVDSAGTHDYHVGDPPDRRAVAHARRRGYDLSSLRARQVADADFEAFDLILAMDAGHLAQLAARCPEGQRHKLRMFLEFAGVRGADVPDPYYGGADGFERVLDMAEAAAQGLLDHVRAHLSRVST